MQLLRRVERRLGGLTWPRRSSTVAGAQAPSASSQKQFRFSEKQGFKNMDCLSLGMSVALSAGFGKRTTSLLEKVLSTGDGVYIRHSPMLRSALKETLFKMFVGGETAQELQKVASKLESMGVGIVIDYAVESDLDGKGRSFEPVRLRYYEKIEDKSVVERYELWESSKAEETLVYGAYQPIIDRMLESIEAAANLARGKFVALKLTSLSDPYTLERTNKYIANMKSKFTATSTSGRMGEEQFHEFVGSMLQCAPSHTLPHSKAIFDWACKLGKTYLTFWDVVDLFHPALPLRSIYQGVSSSSSNVFLEEQDFQQNLLMTRRLSDLGRKAKECGVRILVDAEQSYFQLGIRCFTRALMKELNRVGDATTVYDTYQCYLKDTLADLTDDLACLSDPACDYRMGVKLVRGAYMNREREIARSRSIPCVVNDTIQDTHCSYDKCVELLLARVASRQCSVVLATHNERSLETAVTKMGEFGISKTDGELTFAQLYGMAEPVTCQLADHGYVVYKYVPYGPLEKVLPYLVRRAQENSSVIERNSKYSWQMVKELASRVVQMKCT